MAMRISKSRPQVKKQKTGRKKRGQSAQKTLASGYPRVIGLKNVLFKPERSSYVRKESLTKGCVFCDACKSGVNVESLCIYQTDHSMLLVNKFPYNSGHVMVMPKKHLGDVLELNAAEYADLMALKLLTVKAIRAIYEPQGINIGVNLGEASGAGIPGHLHYHLVPRWRGDLNFFPLIGQTKVVLEETARTFERFKEYLDRSMKESS
jgi:ATP adenylyltransferase